MKPPRNVSGSALESVSDRHRAGPPDPGTAGIAHVRILFDQGVPVPLRKHLSEYAVDTTFERGWSTLDNGAPLNSAEADGHKILITDDQNLRHQENLAEGRLAIVVLSGLFPIDASYLGGDPVLLAQGTEAPGNAPATTVPR